MYIKKMYGIIELYVRYLKIIIYILKLKSSFFNILNFKSYFKKKLNRKYIVLKNIKQ